MACSNLSPWTYLTISQGRKNCKKCLVTVPGRHCQITWAVPPQKSATALASISYHRRIARIGILAGLMTHNGTPFVSKFSERICNVLRLKHLIAIANLLETNWNAERCNRTLVERFHHVWFSTKTTGISSYDLLHIHTAPGLVAWLEGYRSCLVL